jgi:hypothetical protein
MNDIDLYTLLSKQYPIDMDMLGKLKTAGPNLVNYIEATGKVAKTVGQRVWPAALASGVALGATAAASYGLSQRSKKTGKSLEEQAADRLSDLQEAREIVREKNKEPPSFASESAKTLTKGYKEFAKIMADHPVKGALAAGITMAAPVGWALGRKHDQAIRNFAKANMNKSAASMSAGLRGLPALPKVNTVKPSAPIPANTINASKALINTSAQIPQMTKTFSVTAAVAEEWGRELAKEAMTIPPGLASMAQRAGNTLLHAKSLASATGSAIAQKAQPLIDRAKSVAAPVISAAMGPLNKAGPLVHKAMIHTPTWQRAAVGAGVGAGVNMVRNRMKPKDERGSYLGAAATGGAVGALGGAASKGFAETSRQGGLGRFFAGNMGQPKPISYTI